MKRKILIASATLFLFFAISETDKVEASSKMHYGVLKVQTDKEKPNRKPSGNSNKDGYVQTSIDIKTSARIKREKEKIKKAVRGFYNAAKIYNQGKMNYYFLDRRDTGLFVNMKEMASFCRKQNKKMSYKIKSVSLSGQTATARVFCKYVNAYSPAYYAFDDLVDYMVRYQVSLQGRAMNKKHYQFMLNNTMIFGLPMAKKTIKISLAKKGSKWKIKGSRSILDTINCNYESAYQDHTKAYQ